jgi:hypothetical protein
MIFVIITMVAVMLAMSALALHASTRLLDPREPLRLEPNERRTAATHLSDPSD